MTELRSIASDPKEMYVYSAKDFSLLSNIAKKVIIYICDGTHNLGRQRVQAIRVEAISLSWVCSILYPTILCFPPGAHCKTTYKADIVLLVDGSTSIGLKYFKTIQSFIAAIVSVFNIGPDRVQIGNIFTTTTILLPLLVLFSYHYF